MTAREPKRKSDRIMRLVVSPGYGADQLHLRQTEQQVRGFLGKPQSTIRKFKGQYFLNYFRDGIQVDVGRKGGHVKYIYFYRDKVRKYCGAPVVTIDGLTVADRRSKVLQRRGTPNECGEAFVLHWGEYVGEWWYYKEGINFTFGRDHRVDMISILPQRGMRRRVGQT